MQEIINFELSVNGHRDDEETIEQYAGDMVFANKSAIIENFVKDDKIVLISVTVANSVHHSEPTSTYYIACASVLDAMSTLEVKYPRIFKQLPALDHAGFEQIAAKQDGSSNLRYHRVKTYDEKDDLAWIDSGDNDVIGKDQDIDIFTAESITRGFYCDIRCFRKEPNWPWHYVGADFNSLITHVTKDYK